MKTVFLGCLDFSKWRWIWCERCRLLLFFFCADVIGRADKPTEIAFLRSPNAPVRVHIRAKKKLKENNKTRTPRTNTIIALRVFCSFVCSFFRWIRSSFFFSWRQMKEKDLRCFLFFFPIAPSSFTPKYCVLFLFVFFCFFWLWLRIDFFDEPAHREQNPTTDEEEEKRRRANRNSCVFGQPFCLVWVCVCVCVCVCVH